MEAEAVAVPQPVSAQIVGNAFVRQYYHILHHSPGLVYRFYQEMSKLGRPEEDGTMSITTTMQAINDKILSLNYGDFRADIKSVDAQESFNGGVHVLVTGYFTGKDDLIRNFSQSFFLAPQERGYFVLNDMFRYLESGNQHGTAQVPATVVAPVTLEPDPPQVQHNSDQNTTSVEESNDGEVYNPPENGNVPVVEEEEVPVAEVVNEMQNEPQMVVESDIKIEDAPKKSYASMVMHLKGSPASFSPPPAPAPMKPVPKSVEQVHQPPLTETDVPVSGSDAVDNAVDNVNNHEGEATDGHSIYLRGLPINVSVALLAEEFQKFGPIKKGGIQIRNRSGFDFGFGFVEFEFASAVQKAIEASPILISRREVVVEEKRSTNRGNSRGSFQSGREFRYGNDGIRGRGNYGGGRGYGGGDFGGRTEFNNRGGYRGGDGYQRVDNRWSKVGRTYRASGIPNGTFNRITS